LVERTKKIGILYSAEEKKERLEVLVAQNAQRINAGTSDPTFKFFLLPSFLLPLLPLHSIHSPFPFAEFPSPSPSLDPFPSLTQNILRR